MHPLCSPTTTWRWLWHATQLPPLLQGTPPRAGASGAARTSPLWSQVGRARRNAWGQLCMLLQLCMTLHYHAQLNIWHTRTVHWHLPYLTNILDIPCLGMPHAAAALSRGAPSGHAGSGLSTAQCAAISRCLLAASPLGKVRARPALPCLAVKHPGLPSFSLPALIAHSHLYVPPGTIIASPAEPSAPAVHPIPPLPHAAPDPQHIYRTCLTGATSTQGRGQCLRWLMESSGSLGPATGRGAKVGMAAPACSSLQQHGPIGTEDFTTSATAPKRAVQHILFVMHPGCTSRTHTV
jgi:hypothetical protein